MKVIALANQKGGVGKTVSTYNLATSLAMKGYSVLMVDLDSQCSLTYYALGDQDIDSSLSATQLFTGETQIDKCCIFLDHMKGIDTLYFIPGSLDMATIERDLYKKRDAYSTPYDNFSRILHTLDGYFDYALLDCPPNLGDVLISALTASDYVVVPVKPEKLSIKGLPLLYDTINIVKKNLNPTLQIAGVILTMYRKISKDHNKDLETVMNSYELLGIIKESSFVTKDIERRLPVVFAHKTSEISVEYKRLANSLTELS